MSAPDEHGGDDSPAVGSRWPELVVSGLLMVAGVVVILDARRVGTGWDEFDGPRAGYFPFYIGCALLASSAWIFVRQLLAWRREDPVFARRAQLGSVWAMAWPTTVFVAAVHFLGIYVSGFLLIAYFMLRHGRHGALLTAAVSLGVPLVFFLVFERWFLVALPKGPLEAMLGL